MTRESLARKNRVAWYVFAVAFTTALLAVFCWGVGLMEGDVQAQKPEEAVSGETSVTVPSGSASKEEEEDASPQELKKRLDSWEKMLLQLHVLLVKAEDRSYDTKLMARQLVRMLRVVVILLFVIVFAVPVCIWFLGRGALLGMPSDVASTLIAIEERQAKLVNIFKEMQDEMEVLQSMSGPDLKQLLSQAAEYMKQNEQDLKTAGVSTRSKGR